MQAHAKGSSLMQPLRQMGAEPSLAALGSAAFNALAEADVAPDAAFFQKYQVANPASLPILPCLSSLVHCLSWLHGSSLQDCILLSGCSCSRVVITWCSHGRRRSRRRGRIWGRRSGSAGVMMRMRMRRPAAAGKSLIVTRLSVRLSHPNLCTSFLLPLWPYVKHFQSSALSCSYRW